MIFKMIKYHTILLTKENNTYTITADLRKYTEFRISSVFVICYEYSCDPKCNYFIIESDGGFITEKINNKGVLAHFEMIRKRISSYNCSYTLTFSYNNPDFNDWTKIGDVEYDKKIPVNIRTLIPHRGICCRTYNINYKECYIKLQLR